MLITYLGKWSTQALQQAELLTFIISQVLPGMGRESFFVKSLQNQSGSLTLSWSFTVAAWAIGNCSSWRMELR